MARDFGAARPPAWRRGRRLGFVWYVAGHVGLVAGFLVFASLPTMLAMSMGNPAGSDELPRQIQGRPCRPISKAEFYRGYREPPHIIQFEGVAFARRRGDIFCNVRRKGVAGPPYPICELDAPVELGIGWAGRERYFDVSPGYTAVVEAKPAGPRCTIAGRYRP